MRIGLLEMASLLRPSQTAIIGNASRLGTRPRRFSLSVPARGKIHHFAAEKGADVPAMPWCQTMRVIILTEGCRCC